MELTILWTSVKYEKHVSTTLWTLLNVFSKMFYMLWKSYNVWWLNELICERYKIILDVFLASCWLTPKFNSMFQMF